MERIMVEFEGEGAGEGEFTWGQREWWADILEEGIWWPIGGVVAIPPGRSLDDLVDELRYRMSRFPALRTRVRLGQDGRPRQVVAAAGVVTLDVVDAGEEDPGRLAEDLQRRYTDTAMDYATDWPIRTGVVCRAGLPTHVVVLISHLVIDAAGVGVLVAQSEARTETPPRGRAPLEQAVWQASAAGQRQNAAALRYCDEVLRKALRYQSYNPDGPDTRRYWHGEFDTYALLPAVQAISERTGVDVPVVFLGLFAVAVHESHGADPVVVRPMVDNRFHPSLADVVCTAAQNAICLVHVAGSRFDDVLQAAARAARKAYKYAYVDPWDVAGLIERVQAERGMELDTHWFLNNRLRPGSTGSARDALSPHGVGPIRSSRFAWTRYQDKLPLKGLVVQIDGIPDGVRLNLHIDTSAVRPADAEALARRMEAIALAQ
jgi:hypothetical protein